MASGDRWLAAPISEGTQAGLSLRPRPSHAELRGQGRRCRRGVAGPVVRSVPVGVMMLLCPLGSDSIGISFLRTTQNQAFDMIA